MSDRLRQLRFGFVAGLRSPDSSEQVRAARIGVSAGIVAALVALAALLVDGRL
ncbi:hypothetical protein AAG612_07460 [Citromicrobium bathyomarinum]|uniref:hypothetical protein n=1 Tax=Citromicrobium bathyomarinum TaxID=72174 RepID=UPI003159D8FF